MSGLAAGTYAVKVTDANGTNLGCFSTATYDLTPNTPTLTIVSTNVTKVNANNCSALDNGSLTVNSVGGDVALATYNYYFYNNANVQINTDITVNTHTGMGVGAYTVVAENTVTNCTVTYPFNISDGSIKPTATLTKTNNVSCNGTPGGAIEVTTTSPDATRANYTYQWYFGAIGNTMAPLTTGSTTNSSVVTIAPTTPWIIDGLNGGDYWVTSDRQ